jgi:type II secretory ATPase GspE/PulE/Tfp pilus assembly ATPase PilB-like protein
MRFGEHLVESKVVAKEAVEEALQTQKYRKVRLGRLLRDLGHIGQADLNRCLTAHLRPKSLGSVSDASEEMKAKQFPVQLNEWAARNGVLPYSMDGSRLTLLSPCFRDEVAEEAEQLFRRSCHTLLVDLEGYKFLKANLNGNDHEGPLSIIIEPKFTDDQKIAGQDPYTSLFRDTVVAAKEQSASDIHIQPTRSGVDIRFRINGDLILWKALDLDHRQSFINEVKRLTNLSIAMSGRAQDGRVSFKNWKLDIRTSLLPSQYGEKIVLRLLDLTRSFDLDAIGFDDTTLADLKSALRNKNGVMIISGPTGSGKTSTLYTLLSHLDRNSKNILTLEDPIEYGIDGITQVQASPKLSFSDALRAVLRQDPDVILVGEVRDSETADLCVKAAMTGHLVLSTLHANGAAEVVSRLLNLGVDSFSLRSCLRFSAAQRLLKRLCDACAVPLSENQRREVATNFVDRELPFDETGQWKTKNLDGCSQCRGGVVGRVPVLEYMRGHEVQDYLSQPENKPRLNNSLAHAAAKLSERGIVDVFDALEID